MRILSAFLAIVLFAIAIPSAQAFDKKAVTDDTIYDQVRRKLADDPDVKGGGLEVEVHQGAVTLKGKVQSEMAKAKATKLTKKVKGVVSVDNQLIVSM